MGLVFFPRGGSAHVANNLTRALSPEGWNMSVLSGSVSDGPGDATEFYSGLDIRGVDYTEALELSDPMLGNPPMHPSYEDRENAPDRILCSLDDATYEHHVRFWERELYAAGAKNASVLHLHHLTMLHEAAARIAPEVPVVTHLHGTELLMLEQIEREPGKWPHGHQWVARLRRWAQRSDALIVLSSSQQARAQHLLGIDPKRCTQISNGFDPVMFTPRTVDRTEHWRHHLVENPLGCKPGEPPGSLSYNEANLAAFAQSASVLLYVGRFTEVKRVALLIEAYESARARFAEPAPLVLLGGFPGEWEGEHPYATIQRIGAKNVFFAGWHPHARLPDFFAAADAVVLPSVREAFGQVIVEGMACGLPAIAANAFGPAEIVDDGETGWLVKPDDRNSLADALVHAVNDPAERQRRGVKAHAVADDRYAWPALARQVAEVYQSVVAESPEVPVQANTGAFSKLAGLKVLRPVGVGL